MAPAEDIGIAEPEEHEPVSDFVEALLRAAADKYARDRLYGRMVHLLFGEEWDIYRAMKRLGMLGTVGRFGRR